MSEWQPIETAPKGGFPSGFTGDRLTTDPAWVEPPRILAVVDGEIVITYWDWYYAEGGNGYELGRTAWVDTVNGNSFWKSPTHWMPCPAPPVVSLETPIQTPKREPAGDLVARLREAARFYGDYQHSISRACVPLILEAIQALTSPLQPLPAPPDASQDAPPVTGKAE